MVLGTHPAKPYSRRIWFAPFDSFHCTTSGKLWRDHDRAWDIFTHLIGPFVNILLGTLPRQNSAASTVLANRLYLNTFGRKTYSFSSRHIGCRNGSACADLRLPR
jgi:hypothetical protein